MAEEKEQPGNLADFEYKIAKLELGERDVVVIKTAAPSAAITPEMRQSVTDFLKRVTGHFTPVILLGAEEDISILTRAEIESRIP